MSVLIKGALQCLPAMLQVNSLCHADTDPKTITGISALEREFSKLEFSKYGQTNNCPQLCFRGPSHSNFTRPMTSLGGTNRKSLCKHVAEVCFSRLPCHCNSFSLKLTMSFPWLQPRGCLVEKERATNRPEAGRGRRRSFVTMFPQLLFFCCEPAP